MFTWLRSSDRRRNPLAAIALASTLGVFAACGDDSDVGGTNADHDAGRDSSADVDSIDDASSDTRAETAAPGSGGASSDADTDSTLDAALDAREEDGGNSCPSYPLIFTPDPAAEARARSALASLAPAATLSWRPELGSLDFVSGLELELPGCVPGTDVFDELWSVAEATPALFQLSRSEWANDLPVDCGALPDGEDSTVRIHRTKLGAFDIQRDVFAFSLRRENGSVRLLRVFGTYVPQGSVVLSGSSACATLPASELTRLALLESYQYSTFFRCTYTGMGSYQPNALDQVSFEGIQATWYEDRPAGRVVLTLERAGRLVVDPSNFTDALLASDANCPEPLPGDGRVIGFRVTIDAVTGAVLSKLPGLDCVVC